MAERDKDEEQEYCSESDEDYVPSDDSRDVGEERDDGAEERGNEDGTCSDGDEVGAGSSGREKPSKNPDDIWAEFQNRTTGSDLKRDADAPPAEQDTSATKQGPAAVEEKEQTIPPTVEEATPTEEKSVGVSSDAEPQLAGEQPKKSAGAAAPPWKRKSGGLAGALSSIKKGKMSTLEKSKLDWSSYKAENAIDEELASHNKGKSGFVDRQDFLQRADLRQFEIEKGLREKRRKPPV